MRLRYVLTRAICIVFAIAVLCLFYFIPSEGTYTKLIEYSPPIDDNIAKEVMSSSSDMSLTSVSQPEQELTNPKAEESEPVYEIPRTAAEINPETGLTAGALIGTGEYAVSSESDNEADDASALSAPDADAEVKALSAMPEIVDLTSVVVAGDKASITVRGLPDTEYSIKVFYSSGASKASGLEAKRSDSSGIVSWTWRVGARTKVGDHRITVSGGGETLETVFTTE